VSHRTIKYTYIPDSDEKQVEDIVHDRLIKTYKGQCCERDIPSGLLAEARELMKKFDLPGDFIKEDAKWDTLKSYSKHNNYRCISGTRWENGEDDPTYHMMDYFNTPKMYRDFVYTMKNTGKLN
jgi:hypothetical protein